MSVKLLTEHHLEFLSLTGGYRGSSESTHVKMSNCWKSHAAARYCDWNTIPESVFSFAKIAKDCVTKLTSLIRAKTNFPKPVLLNACQFWYFSSKVP